MAEDRVTISADANQYFDVLNRAGVAADRLGGSGERAGQGFLKGERVIETSTRNITTGLLNASTAGEALASTADDIVRVFRLPLITGVGITAAVTLFEIARKQINAATEAAARLREEISRPISGLGVAGLSTEFQRIQKEIDDTTKSMTFFVELWRRFRDETNLNPFAPENRPGATPAQPSEDRTNAAIEAAQRRLVDIANQRADVEERIAQLKTLEVSGDKEEAAVQRTIIEGEEKIATIRNNATKDDQVGLGKRVRAQEEFNEAVLQELLTRQAINQLESESAVRQAQLSAQSALAQVGAGPEEAQRIALEAQVKLATELVDLADRRSIIDQNDLKIEQDLRIAKAGQIEAAANLAKFENQARFNNEQIRRSIEGQTEQTRLQATGQTFLADIAKTRLDAELKIAQALRDQKAEVAGLIEKEAEAALIAKGAAEISRRQALTPQQLEQERTAALNKEIQFDITEDRVNRFIDATDKLAEGVPALDVGAIPELTGVEKGLVDETRALREAQEARAEEPPPDEVSPLSDLADQDFSSLIEVAQADFSNLSDLSEMDFSGLEPLDGLTITIA